MGFSFSYLDRLNDDRDALRFALRENATLHMLDHTDAMLDGSETAVVAHDDGEGRVIGVLVYQEWEDAPVNEVCLVAVEPDARRCGVMRGLLRELHNVTSPHARVLMTVADGNDVMRRALASMNSHLLYHIYEVPEQV